MILVASAPARAGDQDQQGRRGDLRPDTSRRHHSCNGSRPRATFREDPGGGPCPARASSVRGEASPANGRCSWELPCRRWMEGGACGLSVVLVPGARPGSGRQPRSATLAHEGPEVSPDPPAPAILTPASEGRDTGRCERLTGVACGRLLAVTAHEARPRTKMRIAAPAFPGPARSIESVRRRAVRTRCLRRRAGRGAPAALAVEGDGGESLGPDNGRPDWNPRVSVLRYRPFVQNRNRFLFCTKLT